MTFLFAVKQKKNVDTFQDVIAHLLAAGHRVKLAVQDRDEGRDARLTAQFTSPLFEVVRPPDNRGDRWRAVAPLVRSARDVAQYTRPAYRTATKLRQRAVDSLVRELGGRGVLDGDAIALGADAGERLRSALAQIEQAMPSDPLHAEFVARHAPDAVVVTPGVHFDSAQADIVKSARAAGVPVWMLLFSWDNLSSKGALHVAPDLLFVWNEQQRQEAELLHQMPAERVVVAGAPRFDGFFALRSQVGRHDFLAQLNLDPQQPTLLYVCSSRFIASRELQFIDGWLTAIRRGPDPLRSCNVIVRPHPDVVLDEESAVETVTWPAMPRASGAVQRPFADRAALILRTTYSTPQAFYECIHHSAAVVGLNTSAELEAGIVGRPVLTVVSHEEGADGQTNTLHFNYLLREHGGFVAAAATMEAHVAELAATLVTPPDPARIRRFVNAFLRPLGKMPVSELLANMLIERASAPAGAASGAEPSAAAAAEEDAAPARAGKMLRLDVAGAPIQVHPTPETKRWRQSGVLRADPRVVEWLNEHVQPGDVLYDIGAGVGAYALLAAVQRSAMVFAFEPGFDTFARLCANVLLNGCHRSVLPLCVALSDRTALSELTYLHAPGEDVHGVGDRWRPGPDRPDRHYAQPVCAERLDDLVARQHLPLPHALRLSIRGGAARTLRGASHLLRQPELRSVLVVSRDPRVPDILEAVKGMGFNETVLPRHGDYGQAVRLVKTGPAEPGSGVSMGARFRQGAKALLARRPR